MIKMEYGNFFENGVNETLADLKAHYEEHTSIAKTELEFLPFEDFDIGGLIPPIMRVAVKSNKTIDLSKYIVDANGISFAYQTKDSIKSFVPDHINPALYEDHSYWREVEIMNAYQAHNLTTNLCDDLIYIFQSPFENFGKLACSSFCMRNTGVDETEVFNIEYIRANEEYVFTWNTPLYEDGIHNGKIAYTEEVAEVCVDWATCLKKHMEKYKKHSLWGVKIYE